MASTRAASGAKIPAAIRAGAISGLIPLLLFLTLLPWPAFAAAISREDYDNPLVRIETSMGAMVLELFPREAPRTVANFIGLAEGSKPFIDPYSGLEITAPFYDGLLFHRVIDDFMIQGGSLTGRGDDAPGYGFQDEINAYDLGLDKMPALNENGVPHPVLGIHDQEDFQQKVLLPLYRLMEIGSAAELEANIDAVAQRLRRMSVKESLENLGYRYTETAISRMPTRGVIAMASGGPHGGGAQFFITLADAPWLAGRHVVFGKVRLGLEALDAIGAVPVDARARPLEDIIILSIRQLRE